MNIDEFVAIDFETANHKKNSACAVALAKVENGSITETYYSLIRPEPCIFHPFHKRLHGITEADVQDAPTFEQVYEEIHDWITDRILVAHNAAFEESVINALFKQYDIRWYPENYICTLYLSRIHCHQLKSHKLPIVYDYLCGKSMNHHDPLEDAQACAEIALKVLNDWQPPRLDKMADALYEHEKGSNFVTNKKPYAQKRFTPSKIRQEAGFENVKLLRGNSFAFTGSPTPYSKHEAAQLIVNLGGKVTGGVTKSTTHLICGELPTNFAKGHVTGKVKKALEMKEAGKAIEIVDATLFSKLVRLWMERLAGVGVGAGDAGDRTARKK